MKTEVRQAAAAHDEGAGLIGPVVGAVSAVIFMALVTLLGCYYRKWVWLVSAWRE